MGRLWPQPPTPSACSPNDGLEEDEQGLYECGGVHNVQSLDVLLVPTEAEQMGGHGSRGRTNRWAWQQRHRARFLMNSFSFDMASLRGECHCCPILQIRKQRLREIKEQEKSQNK